LTNIEQKYIVYLKKNVRKIDETHNMNWEKPIKILINPKKPDGKGQGLAELTKVQACEYVHKLYV
jgi:hypothetical protein